MAHRIRSLNIRGFAQSLDVRAFAVIIMLIALGDISCAVPYAPGYKITKETRAVEFIAGPSPSLHIHGEESLINSGNSDLRYVDVIFPEREAFGVTGLHIKLDGREVEPIELPSQLQVDSPKAVRVRLDPVWGQKQTRSVSFDYTFRNPADPGTRITLGQDGFHLAARGWYPVFSAPQHVLSSAPNRPDRVEYTVRVPDDFLVLARGKPAKPKKDSGTTEYRFDVRRTDLDPFAVAGRYSQSPNKTGKNEAIFWTSQPLTQDSLSAAQRIGFIWNTLQTDFGPLDKGGNGPFIVESAGLKSHLGEDSGPSAVGFSGGALMNPAALALGLESDEFLDLVSHALAHDWFGEQMYFPPDSSLGLGEGLPEYATIAVEEDLHGDAGRRERIARFIHQYDDVKMKAQEKPLSITTISDPIEQRRIGLAKAPLFLSAVEDACGKEAMRAGLKNLVTLLRGREADYASLRSALEESSGKNLAPLFREWLNDKEIPADFRNRYQ